MQTFTIKGRKISSQELLGMLEDSDPDTDWIVQEVTPEPPRPPRGLLFTRKPSDGIVYRARGRRRIGGNEVFLTNIWRRTREEAESDIKVYGDNRYIPGFFRIVSIDRYDYANEHGHYPKIG